MGHLQRGSVRSSLTRAALAVVAGALVVGHAPAAKAGQECPPASFVSGVDVFDGSGTIDWATAAGAGIQFGIAKASQGTYDTDSEFAANWAGMKAAGVIRGAYHFLDPTESGVDQANFFLGIMGTLEAGDLPPVLDIECPTSNTEPDSDNCLGIGSSGDATGAAITQVMNDWLTTVKAATGRTPVVYSYGSYFSGDGIDTTGLQNYPLYIASLTGTNCLDFPDPWTSAAFWQYNQSGDVAGIGNGVDLDYFIGDSSALSAFIGTGSAPIPDAGAAPDAGTGVGVPCTVTGTGTMGVCMLTSTCASAGGTSTADFCPGLSDVQCCTGFTVDAGTDATVGSGTGTGGGSGTGTGVGTGAGTGTGTGIGTGAGTSQGDGGTAQGGTLDGGPSNASSRDGAADGSEPGEDGSAPSSGGCAVATHDGRGDAGGASAALLVLGAVMIRKRKRAVAR